VDIDLIGWAVVDEKREEICLAKELIAGLWKTDMMAMMKAVASSKSALFEDFASRLVILGGMIGFVLLMEKTVESVKVLVI
jgi:hypothetical protein